MAIDGWLRHIAKPFSESVDHVKSGCVDKQAPGEKNQGESREARPGSRILDWKISADVAGEARVYDTQKHTKPTPYKRYKIENWCRW